MPGPQSRRCQGGKQAPACQATPLVSFGDASSSTHTLVYTALHHHQKPLCVSRHVPPTPQHHALQSLCNENPALQVWGKAAERRRDEALSGAGGEKGLGFLQAPGQ